RRSARVRDDPFAGAVRVPGLHRGPFVGMREGGEDGVARVDVGEVAAHDLRLAAARPAAEVAPHRIDWLPAAGADEVRSTPTVLVREGWPGEIHAHVAYSFLRGIRDAQRRVRRPRSRRERGVRGP